MKKLLAILFILSAFVACKDDDKAQPELTVEPATLSFGAAQEVQTFTITANIAWTAASNESWCTVSPASGNGTTTISVTAAVNDGTGTRPATISITSSELGKKELTVTQLGLDPVISFDDIEDDIVQVAIAEATVEVKITTNADVEVTPKVGWIHFLENAPTQSSTVGRTLKFKLDENGTGGERSGNVEVKDKNSDAVKTLTFTQSGSWRQADSLTLLAIYEKMDATNWLDALKWDINKPLDEWNPFYLKFYPGSGRVKSINIQLTSSSDGVAIPVEIANLQGLDSLIIYGALGPIPAELGLLDHLEYLSLGGRLTGNVPLELGNLAKLKSLSLTGSEGGLIFSTDLWNRLNHLQSLSLSNQLTDLPEGIIQLNRLESLDLSRNQLAVLPKEIAQLAGLADLNLSNNQLTNLPEELFQLSNLFALFLSSNQLTSIPQEISQLANLGLFRIRNNNLQGSIPLVFTQFSNLTILDLSGNQLTGSIPPELFTGANSGFFAELSLYNNQLTGTLPVEMVHSFTSNINFQRNMLGGEIPSEILADSRWVRWQQGICPQKISGSFTNFSCE